jgi:hypothetical protein
MRFSLSFRNRRGIKVSTASGASQGKGLDTIGAEMQALLQ